MHIKAPTDKKGAANPVKKKMPAYYRLALARFVPNKIMNEIDRDNISCYTLQNNWHVESEHFIDVIHRVNDFKKKSHEFMIESLKNTFDFTCFPVSRCPQGCSIYPEEDLGEEIDFVPVSHWLAFNMCIGNTLTVMDVVPH